MADSAAGLGMRRAAKVDANHGEIVEALRKAGYFVQSLAAIGGGCPDLLVACGRRWMVMEVKDLGGKLTPDQKIWHATCEAPVPTVRTPEQALTVAMYWSKP